MQGQTKPKYTSLQLIVLSAIQPIGLYYLFTLYKYNPNPIYPLSPIPYPLSPTPYIPYPIPYITYPIP